MALPYMQIYFKSLGVLRVSRAQYVVLYRKPYYVIRYIIILLLYVARQYRFGARRLCRCVYRVRYKVGETTTFIDSLTKQVR